MKSEHRAIIDEWFLNGWNGTQAWLSQYPNSSEGAAAGSFYELTKKPHITAYIKEKHRDAETLARTTHEAILQELRNWAYADVSKFLTIDFEQIKDLPENIRRLITGFKKTTFDTKDKEGNITSTRTTVELKFTDKKAAVDMINKHVGFYGEHNKQKLPQMTDEEKDKRIAELRKKMIADTFEGSELL